MNKPLPIFTIEFSRRECLHTELLIYETGKKAPIVLRGDGMWQWGLGIGPCSITEYRARAPWIRSHGTRICWAEWLYDGGLEGWHTCVLETDNSVAILPHHSDYAHVQQLVYYSELPEREVIDELLALQQSNENESFET